MKEIIYIQAGNISNYVGTHFWNAQQSYFTHSGDKEVLFDHDVSFREGVSPRVCHSSPYMFHSPGSDTAVRESRRTAQESSNLTEGVHFIIFLTQFIMTCSKTLISKFWFTVHI